MILPDTIGQVLHLALSVVPVARQEPVLMIVSF